MKFTRIALLFFLICVYKFSAGQADSSIIIHAFADSIKKEDTSLLFIASIAIYGNDKTKPFIIEREIPFKQGDYISQKEIQKKLVIAKEQLINTSLFLDVSVYIQNQYGQLFLLRCM